MRTAELGNTYGEAGSQESLLGIASGPNGTVFALYNRSTAEVLMHDSAGSVVRTIGRRGGGPGEFQRITALYTSSDTLFVFDGVGNRIAFYDTAGMYLGATALPAMPYRAITLPGGRFLINANINTAAAVGFPLHILGRDGSILESFGVDEPWYRPDFAHLLRQHVVKAQHGAVWTANRNEYLIERWTVDGERAQSIRRAVDWFPGSNHVTAFHPDTVPNAELGSIWIDGDRIWTLVRVPDRRWKSGLEPATSESGRPIYRLRDADQVFDSVLEILSARDGRLIHSQRFDSAFGIFLQDGRLTHVRYDGTGRPYISLWRPYCIELRNGRRSDAITERTEVG